MIWYFSSPAGHNFKLINAKFHHHQLTNHNKERIREKKRVKLLFTLFDLKCKLVTNNCNYI